MSFLPIISQYVHAFGPLGLVLAVLLLHLVAAPLLPLRRRVAPPLFLLAERLGIRLEQRLNRENRSPRALFVRGFVVAALVGGSAFFAGCFVEALAQNFYHGWMVVVVSLFLCIGFAGPAKILYRVLRYLSHDGRQQAAALLQPQMREDLSGADAHTLIRKAVEFASVSLNRFLVAPVFWFVLAGAPGIFVYAAFSGLHAAFGQMDERRKRFGVVVRGVDCLLNIVPAAAVMILVLVCTVFVSKANPVRAGALILRNVRSYHPFYIGWVLAAVAGALRVTLGGPARSVDGVAQEQPWIGSASASARLDGADLMRAMMLYGVFLLCFLSALFVFILMKI